MKQKNIILNLTVGVFLLLSILVRVNLRGKYYPGWDIVGAAHGYFTLSNFDFWTSIVKLGRDNRIFFYWSQSNSFLHTSLMGLITKMHPWQYWSHVSTFFLWIFTLFVIARQSRNSKKNLWIIGLAWLSSNSLLTFSIAGYPYILGATPFIFAYALITNRPLMERPLLFFLALFAVNESSWHMYETGKMVWVFFLGSAFLLRSEIPRGAQRSLITVSFIQLCQLYFFRGANIQHWANPSVHSLASESFFPSELIDSLAKGIVWTPFLFLSACITQIDLKKTERLERLLMVIALGLLGVLFLKAPSEWRARRTLASEVIFLFVTARGLTSLYERLSVKSDKSSMIRFWVIITLLLCGVGHQFIQIAAFSKIPQRQRTWSLPGFYSFADYRVYYDGVDVAEWIIERTKMNETIFWVYNYSALPENTTDPSGLLERVYLSIGDTFFKERVKVFGSSKSRTSSEVPIADLNSDSLKSTIVESISRPSAGATWAVIYNEQDRNNPFYAESDFIQNILRQNSNLHLEKIAGLETGWFQIYKMTPK